MHAAALALVAAVVLGGGPVSRAFRDSHGNVKVRIVVLDDGGAREEYADGGFRNVESRPPDCVPDAGVFDRIVANDSCKADKDCVLKHSFYSGAPCCYAVSKTASASPAFEAAISSLVDQCGYEDGICIQECSRALCRKGRCTVEYAPSD